MNLTITKEQLLNGLQAVQNVVSTRTTLPILSNVMMRAEGLGFSALGGGEIQRQGVQAVGEWFARNTA